MARGHPTVSNGTSDADATPHRFTFPGTHSNLTQTPSSHRDLSPASPSPLWPRTSDQSLPSPPSTPPRHRHTRSLAFPQSRPTTPLRPSTPSTPRPRTPAQKYSELGIGPPPLLTPSRGRPTLAMSIQLHQPVPSSSRQPQYPASPSTRRHSAQQPPHAGAGIERPPSRSERLLRDTLRRDEQVRPAMPHSATTSVLHHSSPTSPRNHSRRPSYSPSAEEDERASYRAMPAAAGPGLTRNKSAGHVPRRASTSAQMYAQQYQQQQQQATRPSRQAAPLHPPPRPRDVPLARTALLLRRLAHLPLALPLPLAGTNRPRAHPTRSRPPRAVGEGAQHGRAPAVQHLPHPPPPPPPPRTAIAVVLLARRMGEQRRQPIRGEQLPAHLRRPLPPPHPHPHPTHYRRRGHSPPTPLTPPDSPHAFDAKAAGAACRQMEGYVSFAQVDGLGEPDADTSEDDRERERGMGSGMRVGLEKLWRVWGREREVR